MLRGIGMCSQRSRIKTINQIICLLVSFILLILIEHTPTKTIQVNDTSKVYINQSNGIVLMTLPKQEILNTIGRFVRKTHISIEIYLKATRYISAKFVKWRNIIYCYIYYCYSALIIDYIHNVDGKKRVLLY